MRSVWYLEVLEEGHSRHCHMPFFRRIMSTEPSKKSEKYQRSELWVILASNKSEIFVSILKTWITLRTVLTNPTDFWLCFNLTLNVNSKPLTCFFPFIHFFHLPLHDTQGQFCAWLPLPVLVGFNLFLFVFFYYVQYLHLLEIYFRDGRNALGDGSSEGFIWL